MKRIDVELYFPCETQRSTTVWVQDDATDDDIRESIIRDEILEQVEFEYREHDERT